MKKYLILKYFTLLTLLFCLMVGDINAETSAIKKQRTRLKMYYEKLPNNDKKISIMLTQGKGKNASGVEQAKILLTSTVDGNSVALTTLETDAKGEVTLTVEAGYKFFINEAGYATLLASYQGNDSLKSAKKKIEFMDINLDISFEIRDSIRYVSAIAFQIDSLGNKIPIEGIDINIGVDRLYSTLFLEEIETNEEGIGSLEFPLDIPGDAEGNISVVVKLDEHDDYGTVTKTSDIKWGTVVSYTAAKNGRTLYGDEAPIWMMVSIFVFLAGAWYHFILATLKILKMKKLGGMIN